jgi:YHS domain-containing protein
MFRALLYTLLGIFVISVLRMIIGTLSRGVGELFQEQAASDKNPTGSAPPPSAGGGALKRDPVCGTYIPTDNSVRKTVAGEVIYFCSPECRDKYQS